MQASGPLVRLYAFLFLNPIYLAKSVLILSHSISSFASHSNVEKKFSISLTLNSSLSLDRLPLPLLLLLPVRPPPLSPPFSHHTHLFRPLPPLFFSYSLPLLPSLLTLPSHSLSLPFIPKSTYQNADLGIHFYVSSRIGILKINKIQLDSTLQSLLIGKSHFRSTATGSLIKYNDLSLLLHLAIGPLDPTIKS